MQVELFTVRQLCDRYGVAPLTIRRWIAQGVFPAPMRIGRRRVFWPVATIINHEAQALAQADGKPEPQEVSK